MGTLLDSTKNTWAPPRLGDDSPTSELDSRTPKGRGKRGRAAASQDTGERKLRKTRGRQQAAAAAAAAASIQQQNCINTAPASPAKTGEKRKANRPTELDLEVKKSKPNSRSSTPIGLRGDDDYIECPEPNCNKKYKHLNGLKYHQTHAHGETTLSDLSPTLPPAKCPDTPIKQEEDECVKSPKSEAPSDENRKKVKCDRSKGNKRSTPTTPKSKNDSSSVKDKKPKKKKSKDKERTKESSQSSSQKSDDNAVKKMEIAKPMAAPAAPMESTATKSNKEEQRPAQSPAYSDISDAANETASNTPEARVKNSLNETSTGSNTNCSTASASSSAVASSSSSYSHLYPPPFMGVPMHATSPGGREEEKEERRQKESPIEAAKADDDAHHRQHFLMQQQQILAAQHQHVAQFGPAAYGQYPYIFPPPSFRHPQLEEEKNKPIDLKKPSASSPASSPKSSSTPKRPPQCSSASSTTSNGSLIQAQQNAVDERRDGSKSLLAEASNSARVMAERDRQHALRQVSDMQRLAMYHHPPSTRASTPPDRYSPRMDIPKNLPTGVLPPYHLPGSQNMLLYLQQQQQHHHRAALMQQHLATSREPAELSAPPGGHKINELKEAARAHPSVSTK